MSRLDEIRSEINSLDEQLTALLTKRMQLCAEVAEYKRQNGVPVLDSSREKAVLDKVRSFSEAGTADYNAAVYIEIMRQSRAYQTELLRRAEK